MHTCFHLLCITLYTFPRCFVTFSTLLIKTGLVAAEMEHIQKPRHSDHEPFNIPYLCGDGYKHIGTLSFADYGPHLGWTSRFGESDYEDSCGDGAIILQKWLFFGLATEFFNTANIGVDTKDFIRREENGNSISTHILNQFLIQWVESIKNLDSASRVAAADTIERHLTVAQVTTKYLGEREEVVFSKVVLSVLTLGAILTYVRRNVFKPGGMCPIPGWKDVCSYRGWGKSRYLVRHMKSTGWCLSEIAYLYSSTFSVMGLVFAAQMKRPKREISHASCTETVCTSLQVKEDTYKTEHARDGCGCQHLEPDQRRVCSILHRGGIPIIQISKTQHPVSLQLEVVESKAGLAYVAISHVWAHGLGHVSKNSLPECQFERLYQLLQNLENGTNRTCLWIDTLCVPARPHAAACEKTSGTLTCRKIAITRLKETYQNAAKVLVLDWEIERSNTSFPEETLMRIVISAWMKRLWTFQEAKLARHLYFQFKDKAVRAEDMLSNLETTDYQSLWAETAEHILGLRGVFGEFGASRNIVSLWNSFQSRSTSNAGDEALCLSVMLGSDTEQILDTPDDDRMRKLFSLQEIFPSQILFMPGPRINSRGYGWAPTSFLSRGQWANGSALHENQLHHAGTHTMNLQSPPAYRADSGLLMRSPGFLLKPTKYPLTPYFAILDSQNQFMGAVVHMQDQNAPVWSDMNIGNLEKLAVLLDGPPEAGTASLAVLLSGCSIERDLVFAKFECRLWFGAAGKGQLQPQLESEKVDEKSGLTMAEMVSATITKLDQMWCVS